MQRFVVSLVLLVTVPLAGCSAGSGHRGSPSGDSAAALEQIGTPLDSALPASVLHLPLRTSDGRVVRLADFAGKTVALSDATTLCQETCPLDTATIVQTARSEDAAGRGSHEVFLSITIDPERDTVPQMAAYRHLYSPAPTNWLALTGSPSTVKALWDYLGVWRHKVAEPASAVPRNWRTGTPLTYDVQHSDEVFFLDPAGHERFVLEGPPYAARASLPETLYTFMNAQGHRDVAHPSSSAWTEAQARRVLAWVRR